MRAAVSGRGAFQIRRCTRFIHDATVLVCWSGLVICLLQMMGQVGAVAAITVSGAIVAAGHGPGRFAAAFLVAAVPALLSIAAAGFIQTRPASRPDAAGHAPTSLEKADDPS